MAIKRYGTTILRTDSDGDSVPFKMSAETLILYKSYNNSDFLADFMDATGVDLKDFADEKTVCDKQYVEGAIVNTNMAHKFLGSGIIARLIFTSRLAAESTEESRNEVLDIGMDAVPANMINEAALFYELVGLVIDLKKNSIPNQQQQHPTMTKRKNFKCMGSRQS